MTYVHHAHCPYCHETIRFENFDVPWEGCPHCGRRLDWDWYEDDDYGPQYFAKKIEVKEVEYTGYKHPPKNWLRSIWCFFVGHDWFLLRQNKTIWLLSRSTHPMAGSDADCNYCGTQYRDWMPCDPLTELEETDAEQHGDGDRTDEPL